MMPPAAYSRSQRRPHRREPARRRTLRRAWPAMRVSRRRMSLPSLARIGGRDARFSCASGASLAADHVLAPDHHPLRRARHPLTTAPLGRSRGVRAVDGRARRSSVASISRGPGGLLLAPGAGFPRLGTAPAADAGGRISRPGPLSVRSTAYPSSGSTRGRSKVRARDRREARRVQSAWVLIWLRSLLGLAGRSSVAGVPDQRGGRRPPPLQNGGCHGYCRRDRR